MIDSGYSKAEYLAALMVVKGLLLAGEFNKQAEEISNWSKNWTNSSVNIVLNAIKGYPDKIDISSSTIPDNIKDIIFMFEALE